MSRSDSYGSLPELETDTETEDSDEEEERLAQQHTRLVERRPAENDGPMPRARTPARVRHRTSTTSGLRASTAFANHLLEHVESLESRLLAIEADLYADIRAPRDIQADLQVIQAEPPMLVLAASRITSAVPTNRRGIMPSPQTLPTIVRQIANEDSTTCPICFEAFDQELAGRLEVVTSCNHAFCYSCMERLCVMWSFHNGCPICRRPMQLDLLSAVRRVEEEENEARTGGLSSVETTRVPPDQQLDEQAIELIIEQTGVSRVEASEALKSHQGDIVNAIMQLLL
uniref:RING-type domain-containing protein n=1 Tax=Calcidiscus leptoporus TaxID=127549 RepID=A0A7S0JEE3_9EUKA